jgi:hypothetical protein
MSPETHPHTQVLNSQTITLPYHLKVQTTTHLTMSTDNIKNDILRTKWGNVERLRGDQPAYYRWAMQMQSILMGAGVWKIVKDEEKSPTSPTATEDKINEFNRRSQLASSLIFGSISTVSQPTVREALNNPVELWKLTEKRLNHGNLRGYVMKLYIELFRSHYQDTDTPEKFIQRLTSLRDQLTTVQETVSDTVMISLLLGGLPEEFHHAKAVVYDSEKLTFFEACHRIQAETAIPRYIATAPGYQEAHYSRISQQPPPTRQPESKPDIICFYCKKLGHFKNDCRKLKRKLQKEQKESKQTQEARVAIADAQIATCYYSVNSIQNTNDNSWIMDSGASVHMTTGRTGLQIENHKRLRDGAIVIMGNGAQLPATGKGSITLQTHSGSLMLKDVWVVPGLDANLISVGELAQAEYTLIFDKVSCRVINGNREVFHAPKVKNLYRTQAIEPARALITSASARL